MLFGIAVFPEKHVQDVANRLRRRHDPHYSLLPAHLTVREADEWSEDRLALAAGHLDRTTALLAPFQVRFNRVSTFYPVANVLYLALEQPNAMQALQKAICSGPLAEPNRTTIYTPHLTIGQNMSAEELHDQYGRLRMQSFELTSRIDRVHLLYQLENNSWTVYQTFLLRGQ
jgi:2'-5' RNA ligase